MLKRAFTLLAAMLFATTGCSRPPEIRIDGSSTVYLISEAMQKSFATENSKVKVSVGISGTGGGFKKFAAGETDISDASRRIKAAEAEACKEAKIEYTELQVAWDGLAVIVNNQNEWAGQLTVAQLKKIWHPNSDTFKNATTWKDVDPSFPDEKILRYGAGSDSGTFDYFTEAINGKEKVIRPDYQASEDDNTIVKGVGDSKYAIGFLGMAYYTSNKEKLKAVAISAKEGAKFILPSPENVLAQTYIPLSRPLFIYVKHASLKRPEVQSFVDFYLRRDDIVSTVGYVSLDSKQKEEVRAAYKKAVDGLK